MMRLMEVSEELKVLGPTDKKNVAYSNPSAEIPNKESGSQKTGSDKNPSALPAPFYDELHFADYE